MVLWSNFFIWNNKLNTLESFTYYGEEDLHKSVIWDLTNSPIFIDNSDPENNWDKLVLENQWITGSGTSGDPYLIKDIFISSEDTNCIEIYNSDVYFIIANSYIHTSNYELGIGVYFFNVSNGFLMHSEITNNVYHGVAIHKSSDILVYNNFIHHNNGSGISISTSTDIEISDNTIIDNYWTGIGHYSSNKTIITNNEITSHSSDGIRVAYSNLVTISENTIQDNEDGISFYESNDSLISQNNILNNNRYAIFLESQSSSNTIIKNTIVNRLECIVIGDSCQNVDVSNNGDCLIYSFQEDPPPPPPDDDSDDTNDDDDDIIAPKKEPNFLVITIIGFALVSLIIVCVLILFNYLGSK